MLAICLGVGVAVAWSLSAVSARNGLLIPLVILALVSVNFASLTVVVEPGSLRFWLGPGLVRRSFPLDQVASCEVVTNPWYTGWGIRRLPSGWLYNVSGYQAVELLMHDGRRVRVGTDEPDTLCRAIVAFRGGS
jgi:hypothetical protein